MNANGNGNGTKPLDAQTEREIDQVLSDHKTNKPKGNPPGGTPKSPKTEEKTEKSAPKTGANDESRRGSLAKASEALNAKLAQAANTVVEADKKQKQALVVMGYQEGLEDSRDVIEGHKLGMMVGLSRGKVQNTQSLSEQLKLLRKHTDATNTENVQESLESFMGDDDCLSTLDGLLGELEDLVGLDSEKSGQEGFQLLGKG